MASADSSLPAMMVSPRGDEARNVARRYLAPGLHLADKLHHRRRDTKGRDLMRHLQEGSRSFGLVHDEELLGVTVVDDLDRLDPTSYGDAVTPMGNEW